MCPGGRVQGGGAGEVGQLGVAGLGRGLPRRGPVLRLRGVGRRGLLGACGCLPVEGRLGADGQPPGQPEHVEDLVGVQIHAAGTEKPQRLGEPLSPAGTVTSSR
ncbi:hypothetical protein D3C59_10415 [Streptomyces sp. SHP22-7]|nr:hypothetical protein D3C59_10415 [Streptomyces sp. SHP22-7]